MTQLRISRGRTLQCAGRDCIVLVLVVLCAAPALAQLQADITPLGEIDRLTVGEQIVARGIHVTIIKPEWKGSWGSQKDAASLSMERTEADGAVRFSGQFACEGKPCAFEQTLTTRPDGVSLSYKLTPSADMDTQQIAVMVDLPTEGNAGAGAFYIHDGDIALKTPLPAELPDPYHLAGSGEIAWCGWILPGDVGLRITPDGKGIRGVSFQDNRQFNYGTFEAQFAVHDSQGLRAGRTYEFGLDLALMTQADKEALKTTVSDRYEGARVQMASQEPLSLGGVSVSSAEVARYEKLELDLDLHATFDNPFNPDDIDVTARFSGPDGRVMVVPAFYWSDFDWAGKREKRWLITTGTPRWKVRFAPPAAGTWSVAVTARDRSGTVTSQPVSFTCTDGPSDGFIRRSDKSPYYLRFDSGKPYFAVGENICWSNGAVDDYAQWLRNLGAAGGNYCRIWLVRWNMGLEWTNQSARTGLFYDLGMYSLDNAFRLDWVMEQARENGIYCMLCLGFHGELQDTPDYFKSDCWSQSPYNVANGGPCAKPAEFWTNEQARKLYKQRLGYYIARFGWDRHVLSWEFWNEVNAPAPWVDEMAKYMQANDPYDHLVTTTYGDDAVWQIPEMDYSQAHTYGSDEARTSTAEYIALPSQTYTSKFGKPFMMGEFGIDWKRSDTDHDPKGIGTSMHDGMWASVMARSFGTAAIWYWDGYVEPLGMYREFTPIRKFVDQLPWPELDMQLAGFSPPMVEVPEGAPWQDAVVTGKLFWAKHTSSDFTVNHDGTVSSDGDFSQTLFADSKKDLKAPLRFHVDYPQDGTMVIRVARVSARGRLEVTLDGQPHWVKELPCGPGDGEWKSTKFEEQWGIWQCVYDKDYEIPIPAGKHTIGIENTGDDWVLVAQYVFRKYRDPRYIRAEVYGLRTDDLAILWIHDRMSTWYNDRYGEPLTPIAKATFSLEGLQPGQYQIDWWDTRTGETVATRQAVCVDGQLPIETPTFTRDIAAQARRQ